MSAAFIPQALLIRYLESLPDKKRELESLIESYLGRPDEDTAGDLRSALHRLAGSTAMYGFDGLSNAIRAALRVIDKALEQGQLPTAGQLKDAQRGIDFSWQQAEKEALQSLAQDD